MESNDNSLKKEVSSDEELIEEKDAVTTENNEDIPTLEEDVLTSPEEQEHEEEAAPLESLLLDDDFPSEPETKEESANFESFFNDYRAHISKSLPNFIVEEDKASDETKKPQKEQKNVSSEKKSAKKMNDTEADSPSDDWDNDITLLPESYESYDEEDDVFRKSPLPEEESEDAAFSIGHEFYSDEENEIQFSIKFDEAEEEHHSVSDGEKKRKYDPEHPRFIDNIYDFFELFVITLVCVMVLTTFFFKHSIVEGRSMQNTLADGDSLIITDLFYTPERYDIVVFEDYSTTLKKAVVKRVIGLPGEKVEVKVDKNGDYLVYINDELLPEKYAYNAPDSSAPATGIWYIEEGEVFVMGDNRYNSTDSRDPNVGPIDIDCILGKVILRFYPFDKFGKVE